MYTCSRREFLRLTGATALALARLPEPETGRAQGQAPIGLGRVIRAERRYEEPSFAATAVGISYADTVLDIWDERGIDAADAPPGTEHNLVWYRVDDGWIHSGFVQPVRNRLNRPVAPEAIPPEGFLAEVTVPFTDAWHDGAEGLHVAYRFYYSQTHWVDQVITDKQARVWYRVLDDRYQVYYFVLARHLRRIRPEELTPLSPDVAHKHIEVDLEQQRLTAYENDQLVFTARVSTGRPGVETPGGELQVERKRPSRHTLAPRLRAAQVQVWRPTTAGQRIRPPGRALGRLRPLEWGGLPRHLLAQRLRPAAQPRLHQPEAGRREVDLPLDTAGGAAESSLRQRSERHPCERGLARARLMPRWRQRLRPPGDGAAQATAPSNKTSDAPALAEPAFAWMINRVRTAARRWRP